MSELRLGALSRDDRQELAALLTATSAFSADEIAVALELFDDGMVSSADYELLGAFGVSDELLGYACFGATPMTDGAWDLYWLAVHPGTQRRGVGRALLSRVEDLLAARGARLLLVETSSRESYMHTRQFYDRAGYSESARIADFYAPADDRIILTSRLFPQERGVITR